jgi:hypothetical protein
VTVKVLLHPAEIAARVVEDLRSEGLTDYPFIPADLDDEIARWCQTNDVGQVAGILVREAMASLPGVKRWRPWLNVHDPAHRYIRRRQRARGEENERPTIYVIS